MNPRNPIGQVQPGASIHDARLRNRFVRLWRRNLILGAESDDSSAWDAVYSRYAEPHRKYHNVQHLVVCLEQLDMVSHEIELPDQVEMAIWFHDVIYDPGKSNNEARSAALFYDLSATVMDPEFVDGVVDLILITTHDILPTSRLQQLVSDIDLASFGCPWDCFLADSVNLRAEFQGTEDDYKLGKRRFLEALLQRPKVFLTDFFNDRYEQQARENIRRFLALIDKYS